MDPFKKLPVEVTLSIMENIYSHTTIWRLIQASPTMLSHYSAHKQTLLNTFISKLIRTGNNDDLLQDALGIIGFDATKTDDQATKCHLEQWSSKKLADPFRQPPPQRNQATMAHLHRLFSRLGLLIEDYMGKATSSSPVEAYLKHPPEITYTNTNKRVTLDDLAPIERYRLFRAFLKFEVLCKVYDPRVGMHMLEWSELASPSWEHMDSSLYESIHCVYEYVGASFGGLFARLAWAQERHPDCFFVRSDTKGLLYPDNVRIDPHGYFQDLLRTWAFQNVSWWSEYQGFDLLVHLLSHMSKGSHGNPTLLHWFCCLFEECAEEPRVTRPPHDPPYWGGFLNRHGGLSPRLTDPLGGLSLLLVSRIYEDEDPVDELEGAATYSIRGNNRFSCARRGMRRLSDFFAEELSSRTVQIKMYRQRAWMFCDSARSYPPIDLHFPDRKALQRYDVEATRQIIIHGEDEHHIRRYVQWQDYFTGRTLREPFLFDELECVEKFPENNVQHIPPFFNSSVEGELSTFWRFAPRWD
ncbi:uncharacterized protein FIESC28_07241 [Fusarium coffeatum]|uniref:Uncharacterized protein n=1 Tax=Fusarium coffeatum TaxID=231269 RepID=A0A366RGU8_9HYPO|nr:uncharacterized protein FIESC28_07241 [Fusarium coffeatum]RBR15600.1 hypothetical protein FIESC28_07241 [Fusarium coffeatum]